MRSLPVAVFLLAAIVALASAPPAAAQAPVPTHNVGDAVGFGASFDLGVLAEPYLDQLRALDEAENNVTINKLNLTGSMDIWVAMEVIEETAAYYTIQEDSATGLRAHLVATVTSVQFPAEGTYPGTIDTTGFCTRPNIPYTTKTASVDFQIAYLSTSSGTSKWNVSDFALRESRTNYTVDLQITSLLRNVPSIDFNATACQVTVTYEDSDIVITADTDAEIRVLYNPALDYFDFPIFDDETWGASATATVAGTIAGTINVVGLDSDEEQEFFDGLTAAFQASGLTVTGLTGFPIVLQEIGVFVGADAYLENGVIDDVTAPVSLALNARHTTRTLADGNFHTVYLISSVPATGSTFPQCSWIYSPDDGFIVGYICEIQPGLSFFELENVPPGTAQQEIADTKSAYGIGVAAASPLVDFFLKPPFLGLLLIVAGVVIAILLVRRRGRRAMAPPVPPPPPPAA